MPSYKDQLDSENDYQETICREPKLMCYKYMPFQKYPVSQHEVIGESSEWLVTCLEGYSCHVTLTLNFQRVLSNFSLVLPTHPLHSTSNILQITTTTTPELQATLNGQNGLRSATSSYYRLACRPGHHVRGGAPGHHPLWS